MVDLNQIESDVLDALSDADTAYDFFMVSYDLFDDAVDNVIKKVFHKDDYAVKFVVAPLLDNDGPLGDVVVRLKLLLGLGLLSKASFQSIEKFVTFRAQLIVDNLTLQDKSAGTAEPDISTGASFLFNQELVLTHFSTLLGKLPPPLSPYQQEQRIKSALTLAVENLIKELSRTTPIS